MLKCRCLQLNRVRTDVSDVFVLQVMYPMVSHLKAVRAKLSQVRSWGAPQKQVLTNILHLKVKKRKDPKFLMLENEPSRHASNRNRWKEKQTSQKKKTTIFNDVRLKSLITSSKSFTFTYERITNTSICRSSLYPTRAFVSERIPLVHSLST